MTKQALLWTAGAAALAVGLGLVLAGGGSAADEKEVRGSIEKLASAIEKKDQDEVKKLSAAFKEAELADLMALFKLRNRKGYGIGAKAGAVTPDGIEAKLNNLSTRPPNQKELDTHAAALARTAYVIAAIGEAAHAKSPVEKKEGEKDPKKWQQWMEDMSKSSQELAEAFKAKDGKAVRAAASKVNASCNNCHPVFRD